MRACIGGTYFGTGASDVRDDGGGGGGGPRGVYPCDGRVLRCDPDVS